MKQYLTTMPRETRDTLLVLGVVMLVLLPHLAFLPWWVSALALLILAWRLGTVLRGQALPRKWLLNTLLVLAVAATALQYRTIVGPEAGVVLILLLLVLFSAAFVKAALKVADGRPISVGDLFDTAHAGQLVVLALIYGAAGLVASFIPVIGQIALIAGGFFVFYAVVALVDRGLSPVDAIRESFSLQTRDLGTGILVYLVVALVSWIGSAVCGIGVLVSLPVGALLTVYAYRRLTGGQIAA